MLKLKIQHLNDIYITTTKNKIIIYIVYTPSCEYATRITAVKLPKCRRFVDLPFMYS